MGICEIWIERIETLRKLLIRELYGYNPTRLWNRILILQNPFASEIEKTAINDGMLTMDLDGYLKALEGITTIEEVMRVAKG